MIRQGTTVPKLHPCGRFTASRVVLAAVILLSAAAAPPGTMLARSASAAEDGFATVDLRPIVNMDWRDERWGDGKGWTNQGDNDMRGIETGRRELLGIPFDLIDAGKNSHKAVLVLGSKQFRLGPQTATATLGRKARSLYFLHAAAWSGSHMADYIVHYDDGSKIEIPIRDQEEIMNWWGPTHGPKYRAALHIPNAQCDDVGLLLFGWDNPNPEKVIKSIEFKSRMTDGVVVVTAVTTSDKPVRLPDPKDIPVPDYLRSDLETLDKSQWFPVDVVEDKFEATPIDQSAGLDAPAGKHGFMKTVNGRWAFDDGTPVRLVATMQGTPGNKQESEKMARWLAKYGFNMVRIGHLVTGPGGDSAVDWSQADSGHLNPKVMDQLDYFVAELAKRGIYSRLTMLWYRKLKKADGAEAFDESVAFADQREHRTRKPGEEGVLDSVGITFFDRKVMQANIDLEKAIMTHQNPYRGNKPYGADPAICQIEVTNEDGVFFYTIDGIAPHYAKELDRLWAEWLLKKYGSREKLAMAWGKDLAGDERLDTAAVKRLPIWQFNKVPDKLAAPRRRPVAVLLRTEQRLLQPHQGGAAGGRREAADLRVRLVRRGPGLLSRTLLQCARNGLHRSPPLLRWRAGRLADFAGADVQRRVRLEGAQAPLETQPGAGAGHAVHDFGMGQRAAKPVASEAPPLMAFYGNCLNGWDAPIHFALEGGPGGFTRFLKWMWPVNEPSTACQYPGPVAGHPPRRRQGRRFGVRPQALGEQDLQRPALAGRGDQVRHLGPL